MQLNMPGEHNILNSLAALAIAREINVPIKTIQKSFKNFPGINRRFEIIKNIEIDNKVFSWVDDYGHHPSEMKEVLNTIKNVWENKKIVMIFQPHRYSRTAEHFSQFIEILKNVDDLAIMDIYPANEEPIENITSKALITELKKYNNEFVLLNENEDLIQYINKAITQDSILLTMGAGNISKFVNYYKNFHQIKS